MPEEAPKTSKPRVYRCRRRLGRPSYAGVAGRSSGKREKAPPKRGHLSARRDVELLPPAAAIVLTFLNGIFPLVPGHLPTSCPVRLVVP